MYKIKIPLIIVVMTFFLTGTAFAQTYLINESFTSWPPTDWTNGASGASQGTTAQDGDNASMLFATGNASARTIVTKAVTDPDRITFWDQKAPGGGVTMTLYYSTSSTGPFTSIGTFSPVNNTWTSRAYELDRPAGTYYFQFEYPAGAARDVFIDVVQVTQSIVPNTSSLTGFIYEPSNGPSAEQSFTVSGADLTNDITITPPTNYEISTGTGAGFSATNPITLTQSGGSVNSTTIYVRLKSGLSEGSYNAEDITISSTGKISKTVSCSGDVRQSINPSVETISNFNYDPGSGPSAEQSFTVSGQDLTANISITPPTNYEISTGTGVAFTPTDPITLTQSGGSVGSTSIYVRLKSGLTSGSYNAENITLSSTGKVSRTVTCNGFVGPMVLNVKVFLEGGLW